MFGSIKLSGESVIKHTIFHNDFQETFVLIYFIAFHLQPHFFTSRARVCGEPATFLQRNARKTYTRANSRSRRVDMPSDRLTKSSRKFDPVVMVAGCKVATNYFRLSKCSKVTKKVRNKRDKIQEDYSRGGIYLLKK